MRWGKAFSVAAAKLIEGIYNGKFICGMFVCGVRSGAGSDCLVKDLYSYAVKEILKISFVEVANPLTYVLNILSKNS